MCDEQKVKEGPGGQSKAAVIGFGGWQVSKYIGPIDTKRCMLFYYLKLRSK